MPDHTRHDHDNKGLIIGPPTMQPVTAQQCASKPGSALSGSTEQDESMHSKLATKPSSETSGGEAVEATGSQAAYLATSSAAMVRAQLADSTERSVQQQKTMAATLHWQNRTIDAARAQLKAAIDNVAVRVLCRQPLKGVSGLNLPAAGRFLRVHCS